MERCKEMERKLLELFGKKDYRGIGELFESAKGYGQKCLEVTAITIIKDIKTLQEDLKTILMDVSGKEKPPTEKLLNRILNDAIAAYVMQRSKGYTLHMVIIRFRNGKQRALKSLKSKDRALEIFGVLKLYTLINKYAT